MPVTNAVATARDRQPKTDPRTEAVSPSYPEVPLVLTGAFSLYLLVWFLEFNARVAWLGAIRFEFLLGAAIAVAAVASIALREEDNLSRLTKYICLYFAFLVCHLALSQYIDVSWKAFVDWIAKFACIALFTYAFVRNPRTLSIFIFVLLLAFFKVAEEAMYGKITGRMVWENQGVMRLNGEPGSRYGHPNSLSGYAVCMLPFFYHFYPVVQRKWKACLLVLVVLASNMIIFTGSRTGYLATIALAGFLWIRSTAKARLLAILLLVALVGLPFIPAQYAARFESTFTGKDIEGNSMDERTNIARDAWNLFVDNPQGIGIYTFRFARARVLGHTEMDTHSLYLQVLADLGIGGLIVFGLLIAGLWRELGATERALAGEEATLRSAFVRCGSEVPAWGRTHLQEVRLMRATAAAFLGYLFVRLALGVFGHDLYEVYWWLAAGASIALVNMRRVTSARTKALIDALEDAPVWSDNKGNGVGPRSRYPGGGVAGRVLRGDIGAAPPRLFTGTSR